MILKHQGSAQGPPTSVSVWLPHEGIDVSFIRQAGLLGKDRRPSEGSYMNQTYRGQSNPSDFASPEVKCN
jgi:hypothetical protein